MVLRMLFTAPYYLFRISLCGNSSRISYDTGSKWVKRATIKANRAGRVKIESYGVENIPKENGFIFYPNHQGMYDVLAFYESCPVPFAFVMKKEAKNIILLKQVRKATGSISMDREDIRQSLDVINQVADEVKKGRNFLIFAEGTRSKLGNKMLEMKGGSFKSATKAKCPIVPCALIDSFKPFDESSIKRTTVKIIYLPPMYYDEYKGMKTVDIAAEVKRRIEAAIEEHTVETPDVLNV